MREANRGNALLEVTVYPLLIFCEFDRRVVLIFATHQITQNGLLVIVFVCFQFRGNAGSHDLQLSVETLTAISKLTKEGRFLIQLSSLALYVCLLF